MKIEQAYLVGIHRYSFRCGEPAEILDVKITTPKGSSPRACYCVKHSDDDNTIDYVVVSAITDYEIISESDVLSGNIPTVNR